MELQTLAGIVLMVAIVALLYLYDRYRKNALRQFGEAVCSIASEEPELEVRAADDPPELTGSYRGRSVSVRHFRDRDHGAGGSTNYTIVGGSVPVGVPNGFELEAEGVFEKLAVAVGGVDHEVGDEAFDDRVVVRARSEAEAREFLSSARARSMLVEAFSMEPELEVLSDEVSELAGSSADGTAGEYEASARIRVRTRGMDADPTEIRRKLDAVVETAAALEEAADASSGRPAPTANAGANQWILEKPGETHSIVEAYKPFAAGLAAGLIFFVAVGAVSLVVPVPAVIAPMGGFATMAGVVLIGRKVDFDFRAPTVAVENSRLRWGPRVGFKSDLDLEEARVTVHPWTGPTDGRRGALLEVSSGGESVAIGGAGASPIGANEDADAPRRECFGYLDRSSFQHLLQRIRAARGEVW